MILILSNKWDICVDYVVRLLRRKGEPFLRLNTEDLPGSSLTVKFPNFSYRIHSKTGFFDLTEKLRSVWFRRPGRPFEDMPDELRPPDAVVRFIEDQWHSFIDGLHSIPDVLWINDPIRNRIAECKINQLQLARKVGLAIPRTCITSSQKVAMEFIEKCERQVVTKALYSPLIEYLDKDFFVFTTPINSIEEVSEKEISSAPTIFQELLPDKTDHRITVIGNHCFAVRIESSDSKQIPVDWRLKKEGLRFVPCVLPREIVCKCKELVKQFGLVFGAIDLAEANGQFYFLEVNPNGEWGWLEEEAKLPIAETLTEYLINGINPRE